MNIDRNTGSEFEIIIEAGDSDGASGAGVKRKRRLVPCDNCREKHLKCDHIGSACSRCSKNGERCIRTTDRMKFRHGSSAKYDTKCFTASQIWLRPHKSSGLRYIDETAEIAAIYGQDEEKGPDIGDGQHQDFGQEQQKEKQREEEQCEEQDLEEDSISQSRSGEADTAPIDTDLTPTPGCDGQPTASQHSSAALPSASDATPLSRDSLQGTTKPGDTAWQLLFENEQPSPLPSSHLRGHSGSQTPVPFYSPTQSRSATEASPQTSFLNSLVKIPSNGAAQTANSELEVTLVRYFIAVLACWFDICDPEKHFALIVPHRARWCPSLKNAILAASARHLTRVCNPTSKPDFAYFHDGQPVPGLTEETALHYHSECIKDLVQRSMNTEQTQDASLLTAAIILRFYEEIDAPLRDDPSDNELFLRVINVFIDAQIPAAPGVPHSSPVITGPEIVVHQYGPPIYSGNLAHSSPAAASHISSLNEPEPPSRWRTDGLRQAGFWVAFRQEIHSVFLKQRPFNLSLARCEAFRSFAPAEDAVWADRLVVFCADVLEFCYNDNNKDGGGGGSQQQHQEPRQTLRDRWLRLREYEKMWSEVLPASFEPIYFRDPDRSKGEVFPHICYMIDCHVVGVQYVDLARILLSIYDPGRPKLGPGYHASMRGLAAEVRAAVLRLCGIAMSNRKCPPAFVTAFLGIAMCGDYFEVPLEQNALLGLLDEMETVHAWPAGDTRQALKEAWGKA